MNPRTNQLHQRFEQCNLTREQLISEATAHLSRRKYLLSLGFPEGYSYRLEKRMAQEGLTIDDLWPHRKSAECRFPEPDHRLDLMIDSHAYFYGLSLADGHLQANSRGRGKLSIELKDRDRGVLDALHATLPWKGQMPCRTRVTNFGPLTVCALVYHSRGLRKQLVEYGFPVGKKSDICGLPNAPFNQLAFWRGFLDGDGSLGFIGDGRPFLSLVTTSDAIADAFLDLIFQLTGKDRAASRNKRDDAYNIMVYAQDAVKMVVALYTEGAIAIPRKREMAEQIKQWVPAIKDNEGTAEGSA